MVSPQQVKTLFQWLPLLVIAGTGLIAWGQTAQRVEALEKKAERAIDDHDRIVRIETQIEVISEEQKQISQDVKHLEEALDRNFQTLLEEVRRDR